MGLISIPYTIEKRRAFRSIPFEADLFPKIVFVVGIVLGTLLLLSHYYIFFFKKTQEQSTKISEKALGDLKTIIPILLIYLVCILLLNSLGYIIVSFLFLCVLMILLGAKEKHNYFYIFLISIITVFVTYWVFKEILGIPLPMGSWYTRIFKIY